MRIGYGYDVHPLGPERKLILGGIEIPHSKGLLGHSDSDVLVHAVCDALLGAMGEGDLGRHYPSSDPKYKGISSLKLLEDVMSKLKAKGYRIRDLNLSGGGTTAPRAFAMRAMAAEAAPPAVEPGTTRITVTAHGTVQLQ